MKKFLPLSLVIISSALIVGTDLKLNRTKDDNQNLCDIISNFKAIANNASNNLEINKNILNKYKLSLTSSELEIMDSNNQENLDGENFQLNDEEWETSNENEENDLDDETILNQDEQILNELDTEEAINDFDSNKETISTLYSLTDDINKVCDEYCELKNKLIDAINATNLMIEKVKNKEINLTTNEKLIISNQANQLNNLSKKLTLATNELEFNLSEIGELINSNTEDYDLITFKYLLFLNNIINQNYMINNGLNSLGQINDIFLKNSKQIPKDAKGRFFYGHQTNNDEPEIQDYYIDNNNNLIDNSQSNSTDEENTENNINNETENSSNFPFKRNIDTYMNNNLNRNIDTFFNTALFNNDFMYGGNGYNAGFMNPYMFQNYPNFYNQNYAYQGYYPYQNMQQQHYNNNIDSTDSVKNADNTQHNVNSEKKKFKFKKNIDSYKNENNPNLKTKFSNIKESISNMFNKKNKN